ncbi:MAG: hypothetical protein AAB511_00445 [Patescibacteria group bacterium]
MITRRISNGPGALAILRAMTQVLEHQRGSDPVHFSLGDGHGCFEMSIYSVERGTTTYGSDVPYRAYLTLKVMVKYGEYETSFTITDYDPHERTGWLSEALDLDKLHQVEFNK